MNFTQWQAVVRYRKLAFALVNDFHTLTIDFGIPLEDYRKVRREMVELIDRVIDKLQAEAIEHERED